MTNTAALVSLIWPVERAGEALGTLAGRSGLIAQPVQSAPAPMAQAQLDPAFGRWIEAAADWMGFEAEPVDIRYGQVETILRNTAPFLLQINQGDVQGFLAVLKSGRRALTLLAPDLALYRLPVTEIEAALRRPVEAPLVDSVNELLERAAIPASRLPRTRAALLRQRLERTPVGQGWHLRLASSAGFWKQARAAGLPQLALAFLGVYVPKMVFWMLPWVVLWNATRQSRPDWGWLLAWVLLVLTNLPFRLCEPWFGGLFSTTLGWLFKKRVLHGAMQLEPEEIRRQGVGQLLGRTIESSAAEALALESGIMIFSHLVDLLMVFPFLAGGAGGWRHVLLLLGWLVVILALGWRYYRQRRRWADARLDITHDLVERMVGHRTRLAQQSPDHWHDGEDDALAGYLAQSRTMDRGAALIRAIVPRGWLFVGLLALAPAFVAGGVSGSALALGVGGTLLIYQSLSLLSEGLVSVIDALIAWDKVSPLFRAAGRSHQKGLPAYALADGSQQAGVQDGRPILEAHDLVYRYHPRGEPVVRQSTLALYPGERLLLEGPSGGGKSTLAALLTGLRTPDAGLLLLNGLDPQTLGADGWRRRVATAPQFHENHVFGETFLFNLLVGRNWPPSQDDLAAAESICRELGLGELLDRMPSGLLQIVGETGWQLSHGERSRLYIARALLQEADLVVLDESFAALDPENLWVAMKCVQQRAKTLLVIAHP